MDLLTSNFPPLKLSYLTFSDAFSFFLDCSNRIDIAVGYITADSLAWLKEALITMTNIQVVNLVIGMHYWDKFTEREFAIANELDTYLRTTNRGSIKLVKSFKYHGKLYLWSSMSGFVGGIIGSDNLGSITPGARTYEVSAITYEKNEGEKIRAFIDELTNKSTVDFEQYSLDGRGFRIETHTLEGYEGVKKVDPNIMTEILTLKTNTSFNIPLKAVNLSRPRNNRDGSKSNLNCFFGKGRETPNKRVLPRPWYEVELIPGKSITSLPNYPEANKPFTVITDDGWSFVCQVQGGEDGRKNFRSHGDLQTLGRWVKGRMEEAGALDIGHLVTSDTIRDFGKDIIKLTKTTLDDVWYLEFGVTES